MTRCYKALNKSSKQLSRAVSWACAQSSCSAVPSTAACRLLLLAAPHSVSRRWESDVCAAERQLTRSGTWSSSAAGTGFHIPRGREEGGAGTLRGRSGTKLGKGKVHCLSLREEESLVKRPSVSSRPSFSSLPTSKLVWNFMYLCRPFLSLHLHAQTLFGELKLQFLHAGGVVCSCLREQLLPMPPVTNCVGKQDEKERTQEWRQKWREWVGIWEGGNDSTKKFVQKG